MDWCIIDDIEALQIGIQSLLRLSPDGQQEFQRRGIQRPAQQVRS